MAKANDQFRGTLTEFLRNPKQKRGGFAGLFATVAEQQAKKQGKIFNLKTNKFESTSRTPTPSSTAITDTEKKQQLSKKRSKGRRASILTSNEDQLGTTTVKRPRAQGQRRASLLDNTSNNKKRGTSLLGRGS